MFISSTAISDTSSDTGSVASKARAGQATGIPPPRTLETNKQTSSSIWAPELTVSLVPNPKMLTQQMPKRAHLQQFSSQHRAPLPKIRAQQFMSQHQKAPQFPMTAPQVGAQQLGNREQGLSNKAMHFRSPQYSYHQQKSLQLGAIQHGAPNLAANYPSPPKENGISHQHVGQATGIPPPRTLETNKQTD